MLGILTLDTTFPRIPGDVGARETFTFPVLHRVVKGATVDGVVHHANPALLPLFIDAAHALVAEGCFAIGTTCGFLMRWQVALAAAVDVPVLTSALLQIPTLERLLPAGRRVGVITYSANAVTPELLLAAGAAPDTPVAGVAPDSYFNLAIADGCATLDRARMSVDVVDAARRLVVAYPGIGAIVLECANMPPYRNAVAAAIGLPVYDAVDALEWFYRGVARTPDLPWRAVTADAPPKSR